MAQDNMNQQFLEDLLKEEKFIKALGKNKPKELATELSAMVQVYNEQIDQICRNRVDAELFRILAVIDPNGRYSDQSGQRMTWTEKANEIEAITKNRRVTIRIVREHILQKIGRQKDSA